MTVIEDYQQASRRLYQDAGYLREDTRQGTACHLYGLAAECALKYCLKNLPGVGGNLPKKHLPELTAHVCLHLQGRRNNNPGLRQLLNRIDYMQGWKIDNRYWPEELFDDEHGSRLEEHARRTLIASGVAL